MNNKTDNKVVQAVFGSAELKPLPWLGGQKPDMKWLAEPLEEEGTVAKEFCEGCGIHSEVKPELMDRVFRQFKADEDWRKTDWKNSYLFWNTCDFCMHHEGAPKTVILVISPIKR